MMKPLNFLTNKQLKTSVLALLLTCLYGFVSPAQAIQSAYAAFADGDGDIYTVNKNGKLQWYQHTGRMSGNNTFTNFGTAKIVGDKANSDNKLNSKIFSGDDGIIYTITNAGNLYWSRHDGRYTGTNAWAKVTQIGTGWNKYTHAFSGGDGIIYAITSDGRMLWFRHTGYADGANKWASGSGKQISQGWKDAVKVFSGGNGVIYSTVKSGLLRWHRHIGRLIGSEEWVDQGIHRPVGFNWHVYRQLITGGDGIIYGVRANGDLTWHRHAGWLTGTNSWASIPKTDAGRVMATGWLLP